MPQEGDSVQNQWACFNYISPSDCSERLSVPASSKFGSMPATIMKTKSHLSLPTVDKIIQIKGSMTCFNFILKWPSKVLNVVLHIHKYYPFISHKNIYHWNPLKNFPLLISSSAVVCVLKWSMRLNCQMYFWSPTNIIICLDSTLKLLNREKDCKSPI